MEFNGVDSYVDFGITVFFFNSYIFNINIKYIVLLQNIGGPLTVSFWAQWETNEEWARIFDFATSSKQNNIFISNFADQYKTLAGV